jgi:peptide/nickel transport system substrate-binding protein
VSKHDNGSTVTRLDDAAIATFERQLRESHWNRRQLLGRGLALGLAAPAAGLIGSRAVSAARLQTPTAEKGGDGTLIVTTSGDPLSFNPDFQIDDSGFAPCSNIYNSLLSLNGTYAVIPELATAWEVAADGLSITFHLAEGANWHDGQPVTSADVKYTFEQIVADPAAPANSLIGALASVDTPDPKTAVCNLKQPSASILGFIAWYGVFILPAHLYQGTDWTTNPANQAPVGSGPFKFVSYSPGATIELEANLEYFGEGPFVDKLIFSIIPDANTALQAFLNGEADVMLAPSPPNSQVPTLQSTDGIKVALKEFPSVHYFGFNFNREPYSNVEVRKAIAQAIDRAQIVDIALGGIGGAVTSFYTPAIAWASNSDPEAQAPAFDLAAAAAALDAAGLPVNDGTRFKAEFLYFTASPEYGDIATVLKQQLAAVNIDLELVGLEIGAFSDRAVAGDFDMLLTNGFQGPDPANLRARIGEGGALSVWGYVNPEVERLLDEGDVESDQEVRASKYKELQAILAQDLPIVPLSSVVVPYPYASKVSGVYFDNDDPVAAQVGLNRFTLTKIEN